ncbi:MAG: hypothetical protein CL534_00315 [Ahrensia sp.]|nr:hypothetical protein [Ahrensia sp.]
MTRIRLLSLVAALCLAIPAQAAPITYNVDFSFDASDYFCVGCGGANSEPEPGGSLSGWLTLDDELTGAARLVAFDFITYLPQAPADISYAPSTSLGDRYLSTETGISVSTGSSADQFIISNITDLVAGNGWNSSVSMTLLSGLGGPILDAVFEETFALRIQYPFDYVAGFAPSRNDRRARNLNTEATLVVSSAVPLPASLPLLAAGIGALALLRRRRG